MMHGDVVAHALGRQRRIQVLGYRPDGPNVRKVIEPDRRVASSLPPRRPIAVPLGSGRVVLGWYAHRDAPIHAAPRCIGVGATTEESLLGNHNPTTDPAFLQCFISGQERFRVLPNRCRLYGLKVAEIS